MDQVVRAVPDIDPALFRAARAALGLRLVEAARRAGISVAAVLVAEGRGAASATASRGNLDRLQRAYEEAGVRFLGDGIAGSGIQIDPVRSRPDSTMPWKVQ